MINNTFINIDRIIDCAYCLLYIDGLF